MNNLDDLKAHALSLSRQYFEAIKDFRAVKFELIERLQQAETERDALKAELKATESRLHEVAVGCANAEFELEAARKQEPVAYLHTLHMEFEQKSKRLCLPDEEDPFGRPGQDYSDCYPLTVEPLYASPVPAQQPAEVPPEYPMQPMFLDKGLPRFEKNPIVDWLCEKHGLNEIGIWWQANNVEQKYIEQLYQLIGYSIRGYEELSEVSDSSFGRAHAMAEQLLKGGENER